MRIIDTRTKAQILNDNIQALANVVAVQSRHPEWAKFDNVGIAVKAALRAVELSKLVVVLLLLVAAGGAAWGQAPATSFPDWISGVLATACVSDGGDFACKIRNEKPSDLHVIHLQEFFTGFCKEGSLVNPNDENTKIACAAQDEAAKQLREHGYHWDNDAKDWVK